MVAGKRPGIKPRLSQSVSELTDNGNKQNGLAYENIFNRDGFCAITADPDCPDACKHAHCKDIIELNIIQGHFIF